MAIRFVLGENRFATMPTTRAVTTRKVSGAFCDLPDSARIAKTPGNEESEKKCVYA
jgi:hypothetical protein